MSGPVSFSRHNQIAILKTDNPPVNALGHAVREGLFNGIRQAEADSSIQAIIIICAGRTFFAGADIREFGKPQATPALREVHDAMTATPKLLVAAIHGTALGGGFETALACHYRVAVASAKVGVPEVNLGLLPGAGGTQRLPRLVGVEKALDMITSGRPISAKDALAIGAIDEIVDGDLEAGAIAYTERLLAEAAPLRRISEMDLPQTSDDVFAKAREKFARERRGVMAPQHCISAVEAARLPFADGMVRERELFNELLTSQQSKALRTAFFAEREVAQIPGLSKDIKPRPIASVGIIGAGTMGGGIAMNFLNAGVPVKLVEVTEAALDRGVAIIRKNYEATAAKGRLKADDVEKRMGLLSPSLSYDALADVDLIIEAVFENLDVKKEVFRKIDGIAKQGAVLATNTSTLDVDDIAAVTSRPGDVVGLHFFSPANVMRLLEIVRGAKTTDDVLLTALNVAKTIGKVGVVSGVCYGFIGNRMLEAYGREAELMILEGATPQQVDRALYDFGFAMGPFAMYDLAGLDVAYAVRESHRDKLPSDPTYYATGDRLAVMQRFGQKTGAGFYKYSAGSRVPEPDDAVQAVITDKAKDLGVTQRTFSDQDIVDRCLYAAINEGARILDEGIAFRPNDIDQIWIHGYGFPVHKGGPMFYADSVGLNHVAAKIADYRKLYGDDYWKTSPLLDRLAGAGKSFADWKD